MPNRIDTYLQFGKYTCNCPQWILDKIDLSVSIHQDEQSIVDILTLIISEFDREKYTITTTNKIRVSRCITVGDVLAKRQRTCGSLATVVASVLRSLGIPTKLIEGFYTKTDENMRHAWNDVWIGDQWIPFDITRKNYRLDNYHIRVRESVDWEEIENEWL